MRSGTSNCHVRLSREPIDSPLVTVPNFLVAMNAETAREDVMKLESGAFAERLESAEVKEAISAFFEKRKPNFPA